VLKKEPWQSVSACSKGTSKIAWQFNDSSDADADVEFVQQMMQREPVVKQTIEAIDARLGSTEEPGAWKRIASFARQVALAKLWESWGLEPDAAMGLGESHIAAACTANVMCWFDASVLVDRRRKLIEQTKDAPSEDNQQTKELLDAFEAFIDEFNYYPPNRELICSVSGEVVPMHRSLGGQYWREHVFAEIAGTKSQESLAELSCDTVLQFTCDDASQGDLSWGDAESLYNAVGQFYQRGASIDWAAFYSGREHKKASLPNYPFVKKRYWITELDQHDC